MIVIAGYDPQNAPQPTPENRAKGKAQIHRHREQARLMDVQLVERRTAPKHDKIVGRYRTNVQILPLKQEGLVADLYPAKPQQWQRWDTSISKRVKRAG